MSTRGGVSPDALQALKELCGPGGEQDPPPRWESLTLGDIPGLDQLVSAAKPPIDTIAAVLQAIATILDIIAAILLALPNPLTALIQAAVALIKQIIEDLLATGVYAFAHAPGITGPFPGWAALGYPTTPVKTFVAGFEEGPAPPLTPDAFAAWAQTFRDSVADPGDEHRPAASAGATMEAVFIAGAAADPSVLRSLLYLIGKLFSIQPFIDAWEKYKALQAPDLPGAGIDAQSVAPDWESMALKDLFPELRKLTDLASLLDGLLRDIDNLVGLIKNLIEALRTKVQVLLDLATAIQAVITFLEQLQATGFYVLAVSSNQGFEGLATAFEKANNRPPGGYMGALCLLAVGRGMTPATPLWMLLGQQGNFSDAADAFVESWEGELERDAAQIEAAWDPAAAALEAEVGAQQARLDALVQDQVRLGTDGSGA